jgi:hypothetical protein
VRTLNQCRIVCCLAIGLVFASYCLPRAFAQNPNQFESKLIGRWVVDSQTMCTNPKFKGAGIYYFYDKAGKLVNELRLPSNNQVQVIRRGSYKSIEVFDESSLVIKTVAQSENLQTKETYLTTSLIQFSDDFQMQSILDQNMNGIFNIRDGVVLATKQRQSPFHKCDSE